MDRRHGRRHLRRRRSWPYGNNPIAIRVGTRRAPRKFHEVIVNGPRDAGRFARLVDDQVRAYPGDPLIIVVDGYQPWLEDIFRSCLQDYWSDIADLDKEVQFAQTMQFPERASTRGQYVPWTFIIDQMNVPQVYYWSVGMDPPPADDYGLPPPEQFRFRVGVWQKGRGACLLDRDVSVTIIFVRPYEVTEHVVTELLFAALYKGDDFDQPRRDIEGLCFVFNQLYQLLTDWQNVLRAIEVRLEEAEENSHSARLPVKLRARMMHQEVDRIYQFKEYLSFHTRAFKKLQKLKDQVPREEQEDPLWGDMDDTADDLAHYDTLVDSLKERFNNLLDLEFNIQNAEQSDNSQFLSIIATLFLPVSYLASVFGITTITWPPIWYLWAAIPIFVVSALFTIVFPWSVHKIQKYLYPDESLHIDLQPRFFTMLGDELPDNADAPGAVKSSRTRKKAQRPSGADGVRPRSQSRARTRSEKGD